MTLQLLDKTLIRSAPDEKILRQPNGYGLWRKYRNESGSIYWNKIMTIPDYKVLNIFK